MVDRTFGHHSLHMFHYHREMATLQITRKLCFEVVSVRGPARSDKRVDMELKVNKSQGASSMVLLQASLLSFAKVKPKDTYDIRAISGNLLPSKMPLVTRTKQTLAPWRIPEQGLHSHGCRVKIDRYSAANLRCGLTFKSVHTINMTNAFKLLLASGHRSHKRVKVHCPCISYTKVRMQQFTWTFLRHVALIGSLEQTGEH
jgi:hypothetical protein